jgi:VWFA-related protein
VSTRSALQVWSALLVVAVFCAVSLGQEKPKQEIPDAPSANRPQPQFPQTPPVNTAPLPPESEPAPGTSSSRPEQPAPQPPPAGQPQPEGTTEPGPPPPVNIKTVPPGGATPDQRGQREQLFTLTKVVNFVLLPVAVKDKDSGRLVGGLVPRDFEVYENGTRQQLNFFTSDPFPLSAAVIFDTGMPDVAVRKLNQTFSALQGAFAIFDEVALYTYSTSVRRVSNFNPADNKLAAILNTMKNQQGSNSGPPVLGGPLGPGPPTVNNVPVGSGVPKIYTPEKVAHALNDALLMAATDLNRRPRDRRKIIFIVSDGREFGSKASYSDVLKVLLTNEIAVYAVAVDSSALPGYKQLKTLHIPRLGYDNILPKYSSATGGEVYTEFSQAAIESAYSRAIGDARNQYTLGYNSRAMPGSGYREIEIRVFRPNLTVAAKAGYYPAPPAPK